MNAALAIICRVRAALDRARPARPARPRHGPRRLVGRRPRLRDDLHLPADGRGDLLDLHVPRRRRVRLRLGRRGVLHPRLRDARLRAVVLPAAGGLALRDAAQARLAGRRVHVGVRLARARRGRLGRRRGGDDPVPRAAAQRPRDHRLRDLLRHDLLDRGDLDRRLRALDLRGRVGHPRLGLDGRDQRCLDVKHRGLHRFVPSDPLLRRHRRHVPRGPIGQARVRAVER